MTDFNNVTVSSNGHELIALEVNVEEQVGPVGGAIVCRDIAGNVGVRVDVATDQAGGSSVLIRNGAYKLVNSKGEFRGILSWADESVNKDGGVLELISSTDSPDPLPDGEASPQAIVLSAPRRSLLIRGESGQPMISLGGTQTGDLYLRNASGAFTVAVRAVEKDLAGVWVGGHGQKGVFILRNGAGKATVGMGGGESGDLYLHNSKGEFTIALRAVENDLAGIWVGGHGQKGLLVLRDHHGSNTISLDGEAGDIVLENADCAEEFDVVGDHVPKPGTVMVIEQEGRLAPSTTPYDRRVAGIVSGGSGVRPGIILGRRHDNNSRIAIALAGRAACDVIAEEEPIAVGDLLTTSATSGRAMKAADPTRTLGAVIGKALAPLESGMGRIPVLVTLQ